MTVRELQYATQDLTDSGAVKDTDTLTVNATSTGFAIYIRTESDMEHLVTIPAE